MKVNYIVEYFSKLDNKWTVLGFQDEDIAVFCANCFKNAPPIDGITEVRLIDLSIVSSAEYVDIKHIMEEHL